MDKEYNKIEELIERFFDGYTSNEEERELYSFFSQNEIPKHLQKYKQVFEYFEEGILDETQPKSKIEDPVLQNIPAKKQKRSLYTIAGIAASILIALSVYTILENKSEKFDPYEGSYIVRNGVRITDMNVIRPELEKTYQEVIYQQEKGKRTIDDAINQSQNYDVEKYIKEQYNDLLDQITDDEYTRKEIEKMFESI